MSDDDPHPEIGHLLDLVVHDLRNPVATISANLSFVREVAGIEDPDALEALRDVDVAMGDLIRGLEQLGWIGRWISGRDALEGAPGDLRQAVQATIHRVGEAIPVEGPDDAVHVARGGKPLGRLLEIFVRNALLHASPSSIRVVVGDAGSEAWIEVRDGGHAVADELRGVLFTIEGQGRAKGRKDGRYSRAVGLVAARSLADAIGASLEADGEDGAAVFRIRLPKG